MAEIAARFPQGSSAALGPFLRAVQSELHWIPREAMELAAERFGVSYMSVYEQAAFSSGFSLEPRGEIVLEVCHGLACKEVGSPAILRALEQVSGLKAGEMSADGRLSLCKQICYGHCAIGPNIRLQGALHAGQTSESAQALLKAALQKS
jgi:NADH:ubiquinone oxidoreductase subunit E